MNLAELIFYGAELAGTAAFAISGAMTAIERKLDLFGVLLLSVVTALGGGVTRDLLLGHIPPRMFERYEYVLIAVLCGLAVFLVARCSKERYQRHMPRISTINNVFDAIGLGVFSAIGVQAAIQAGFEQNWFFAITLGMLTGIGGGILRDMMSQSLPAVLHKHIYAVAAIAGAGCYYIVYRLGINEKIAMAASVLLTFGIRILATRYEWSLPKVE
ncbi:trimeric intracellular cation channel family protein [Christensenellaceae bacterium 44-20]